MAVILNIDLPDLPRLTRFAAFQAKKIESSTSLDKAQFNTLRNCFSSSASYLFYDTKSSRLAPPMVVSAESFAYAAGEDVSTQSFSVNADDALRGIPLSLWFFTRAAKSEGSEAIRDFAGALHRLTGSNSGRFYSGGRLAVLSIGGRLQARRDEEAGLIVDF